MARKHNNMLRYLILAGIFCAVCLVYIGRLFYIQIIDREEESDDTTTVRIVYVPAVRGEIFDRNGKALVKNQYTYDLILSYATLSAMSPLNANKIYNSLLDALDVCDANSTHTEKYFPFAGSYPNYAYSADAEDENTAVNFRLKRVLKSRSERNRQSERFCKRTHRCVSSPRNRPERQPHLVRPAGRQTAPSALRYGCKQIQ